MDRREAQSQRVKRLQELKQEQKIEDFTPLRNHLRVGEFAGVSYYDYVKRLREKRTEEKNGGDPNNGSSQPKP